MVPPGCCLLRRGLLRRQLGTAVCRRPAGCIEGRGRSGRWAASIPRAGVIYRGARLALAYCGMWTWSCCVLARLDGWLPGRLGFGFVYSPGTTRFYGVCRQPARPRTRVGGRRMGQGHAELPAGCWVVWCPPSRVCGVSQLASCCTSTPDVFY